MEEHKSYHEEISGDEAVKRLRLCHAQLRSDTCYLTRHSKNENKYVLTVYSKIANDDSSELVKHFQINFEASGKYRLGDLYEFESLKEMLAHYEKHRVDAAFRDIGRCISLKEYIQIRKQEQDRRWQRPRREGSIHNPQPEPLLPGGHPAAPVQPRPVQQGYYPHIVQQAQQGYNPNIVQPQPQNAQQGINAPGVQPQPQNPQQGINAPGVQPQPQNAQQAPQGSWKDNIVCTVL